MDIENTVKQLKVQTKNIRKKRYYTSSLDKYADDLLDLHHAGTTTAELQRHLKSKRFTISHSTIARWLKKHG